MIDRVIDPLAGKPHPVWNSRRLWSLWDMQRFYGEEFYKTWDSLGVIEACLGSRPKPTEDDLGSPAFIQMIKVALEEMRGSFLMLDLTSCLRQIERIELHISFLETNTQESVPPKSIAAMFDELGKRFTDEMKSEYMLELSEREARLYECGNGGGFGQRVAITFNSIAYDADEAAKCLALGRSTASVFHAIRCLEAGIRALSRCLQIADPTKASGRNWGGMLGVLKNAIDKQWPGSSNRLGGDGQFFDNAYAALAAMQNPWRNAMMHLDQKYTEEEAQHIFETVRGFMIKLADRCDEHGDPACPPIEPIDDEAGAGAGLPAECDQYGRRDHQAGEHDGDRDDEMICWSCFHPLIKGRDDIAIQTQDQILMSYKESQNASQSLQVPQLTSHKHFRKGFRHFLAALFLLLPLGENLSKHVHRWTWI